MLLIGLFHTSYIMQLFTIFVARQQYIFPVCFILMLRKIKDLYIVAFNKVKELLPNFLPVQDFIRWLNVSNSDTISDCVSYRYSLVLATNHTSHDSVSVVKTTFKVYGKMQNLTLSQLKIPEPIVTKFEWRNYVVDTYH